MKDKKYDSENGKYVSYTYSWDDKIIALLFFVLLIFAFPTIAMYYFVYLITALFIYLIKLVLNAIV